MKSYQAALRSEIPDLNELPIGEESSDFKIGNPQLENVNFKIEWIQSTETQRMFKSLIDTSNRLVDDAIRLATVNHQQDNAKLIVQKLIEANTLRKVVEDYGNIN